MDMIGRVSRLPGFKSFSQASCPRFERRLGLIEVLLLLILVLTLASCETSSSGSETEGDFIKGDTSLTPPTVTAPANITVAATNASGTAATDAAIASFLNGASAFDTTDGVIATITNDAPAVFPLGANTVTFSATDSDGDTGTAQATVTVADQAAPVTTLLGMASITLNVGDIFTDPGTTASDNVDGDLTPSIITAGAVNTGAVGLYILTYDVSDAAGNAAVQVTRSVSVQDSGAPVVTPPGNITVAAVDATGTTASDPAIVAFLAGATAFDAVDGVIATVTNDAPVQFPLGVTTVTFSATDSSTNTGQVQSTVNVTDQTVPMVTPPTNLAVAATGPSGIAATDPAIVTFLAGASATDNVDGPIATITNNAPGLLPVGVTTVTFSATDIAGNTGTSQATVTVTPFVSVQMIAFSRDVTGQLDLFAIAEDGSGSLVTLASDPGDEVFGGSTSDNRIIYVRDMGGGLNDIFSINDDGSGVPITLTTDARNELPVAVTAANEVIFMRGSGTPPDADLLSISADGSSGEISLAVTADAELYGGLTSGGRVVYDRIDASLTQSDVFSILVDGSGGTVPLAVTGDFEAGGGIAAGGLVIFARTLAGPPSHNDIFTIDADGLSPESTLVATTDDELPVGVTAGDFVIFMRTSGFVFNLLSIGASGTPGEVQLAASDFLLTGEFLLYGGSTGGRIIYNRCDLVPECDVFSRNDDGSGVEATLAGDPVLNEVFAGISSDGRVIIVRDNGVTTELISINADGTGGEILLATAPTPAPPGEVFKGVTANGRVIFERTVGGQTDLFSIMADGSAAEAPLATAATNESFGGIF